MHSTNPQSAPAISIVEFDKFAEKDLVSAIPTNHQHAKSEI
jgi:hypothetical protein